MNKPENIKKAEPDLNSAISNFARAISDLAEIEADPMFDQMCSEAELDVVEFRKTVNSSRPANKEFIKKSLEPAARTKSNEIKFESGKSKIDEITADWVKEWHRNKQMQTTPSPSEAERRSFITAALNTEPSDDLKQETTVTETKVIMMDVTPVRSLYKRVATIAAAAVITAAVLFAGLSPADPSKVYDRNYEPYKGGSEVERNEAAMGPSIFDLSKRHYNSANYNEALSGFSKSYSENPTAKALFYLGLTDLELGRYDSAAEKLDKVAGLHQELSKDATWYLGLACLKTGDLEKAAESFRKLASSKGFYRERSEKILRRLE